MLDAINRMIPHHPGTGKSHHFLHPFPHSRFIAMHRTFPASAFLLSELTMVQAFMGIFQQWRTLFTQRTVPFFQSAIEPDHLLHRFLFLFNARHIFWNISFISTKIDIYSQLSMERRDFFLHLAWFQKKIHYLWKNTFGRPWLRNCYTLWDATKKDAFSM